MELSDNNNLKKVHEKFIKYLEEIGRANATIIAYSKDIEQLLSFQKNLGKKDIKKVERDDIEAFLHKLKSDGYTPKSLSRKINSIKTFYRFLKHQNLVDVNPAQDISHPKYEVKPPRFLSKTEYMALRDACRDDTRTYAIVELFLQTGIRIGELSRLKVSDIKDQELIIEEYEKHPKRAVPLNQAAKEAIDKWLKERPKSDNPHLFITKTGRPLLVRNIRTTIDRYFKQAGIKDAKVNDLRNTFIAHHLASGTPLTTISKLVGHKRLSTTEKYLDLIEEKGKDKVKLGEL